MSAPDRAHLLERAARVLRVEAQAVLDLVPRLDERFARAVELLAGCAGRVIVTGMGKSGLVGRKIAATLASTGTPAYFLHPAEGVHGDIGMVARGDVVLALSNSEEACPMNLAPTSSTTAALAMGDALAMALLDRRGLRPEDYAQLHPRGSLGWRALFKVRDLMHTGDALPVIGEDASMKEAIEEMSRKGLGMTTVVDGAGRLVGVITDGDLRRQQLAHGALLDRRAGDCTTPRPSLIGADELAARALDLMETHVPRPITSLVIADGGGRPVGVIHLHDILRAKIV